MTREALQALVARGETEEIEFRSTGQRTDAAKTVCAMLNGRGGFVLFGVREGGHIEGQQVSARTTEQIAQEVRRLDPPAFPEIEVVPLDSGRSVIILRVSGSNTGTYMYDGRPYIRVGATTSQMPRGEYERRRLERLHETRRWENEPVPEGVTVADLDEDEMQRTVDLAVSMGRLAPLKVRSIEALLRGFRLIRADRLLNASVVLFGAADHLQVLYPQCSLRMARFRGRDRLADFEDNRQVWGHAFALLRHATTFLREHTPIAGRVLPDRLEREDRPRYPPRATREALANALCHRDYTQPGGAVAVAMYDDRLEITNPGRLPFGLTPEKLQQPHESRPWNPLVAEVFYRAGIIEQWGLGTLNMIAWCHEAHAPPPQWESHVASLAVTFLPATPFEEQPELQSELQPESLADRVVLLLDAGPLSKSALSERLGQKTISGQLNKVVRELLDAGRIAYTIPEKPRSRNQRYRLTAKGEQRLREMRTR